MDGGTNRIDRAATDPLIGRVLNERFEIVRLIGKGGVGAVYLAMQAPFNRPCALKVLRPRYQGEEYQEFRRRFFLEASTAAKLSHPNNVAIFDYGHTDDGMYFMAMEYLEGRTLRQAIREDGPFGAERTSFVARQICRALREAHHHGVIHRDIKPGNIFLVDHQDEKDFAKVLDFGLVKNVTAEDTEDLTQAGLFMGSPKYVAPEQIQGEPVDARTDIYSLGIVMYEMVTGRPPFDKGASVQTLIAQIKEAALPMREMNPACSVTPILEQTIYRCMAKNPAERFPSMDALLGVLKQDPVAALTATMTGDSGGQLADSGALAISGSVPLTATVSAPHVFMAGRSQPTATDGSLSEVAAQPSLVRRHAKTVLAGAVALAAVAGTLLMMSRQGTTPVVDTTIRSGSVGVTVPSQALPSAAKPVVSTPTVNHEDTVVPEQTVSLSTAPVSASVRSKSGKELCDKTPCELPLTELDQGRLTVSISAPGYVTVTQNIEAGDTKVSVRLTPIRARVVPTSTTTQAVPTSYKNNPYGDLPPY